MRRKQEDEPASSGRWVEWFAARLSDPVVRLRFLRAVAPTAAVSPPIAGRWRRLSLPVGLAAIFLVLLAVFLFIRTRERTEPAPHRAMRVQLPTPSRPESPGEVWQVEKSGNSETFSNGLRIDNRFAAFNHPRSYMAFPKDGAGQMHGVRRSDPVGIVFHTTESRQAPFQAEQNGVLKRIGESLLEYVQRRRAYNFLIDRFGRVYRVVPEGDAANHAGYSVWSDEEWVYINLNESFLGVSIEAETQPGQLDPVMSPAQLRAAAVLTEMLRSRFRIAAGNCVTHAQVSVNPSNVRIGYHTDWASSFPFEKLGLPNNYARALPSLTVFGFEYDEGFLHWAGARMATGVELADQSLNERAAEAGLSLRAYRKVLQQRYREELAVARHFASEGDEFR